MELSELITLFKDKFNTDDINIIFDEIYLCCLKNDTDIFEWYVNLPNNNLREDNMQKIYQYYLADRKNLKQDFTPKCLAEFMYLLADENNNITDMCAGSGALTIQAWSHNKDLEFELFEIDENVIPLLIFNMAVRNIKCTIYHADVLENVIFKTYKILKGEKFGQVDGCRNL